MGFFAVRSIEKIHAIRLAFISAQPGSFVVEQKVPASFLIQMLIQRLLDQLLGVGVGFGRLSPQATGKEGAEYQETDDNADGIMQSGSFGNEWTKKGISMHREDTLISL